MSEYVKEVDDSNFEQVVLKSETPILVDFWAAWCRPCRILAPTVEAVAEQYTKDARVAKLNVDENPAITQRYGIQGIPTLVLFRDGKEKERITGVTSKEAIARMIDKYIDAFPG